MGGSDRNQKGWNEEQMLSAAVLWDTVDLPSTRQTRQRGTGTPTRGRTCRAAGCRWQGQPEIPHPPSLPCAARGWEASPAEICWGLNLQVERRGSNSASTLIGAHCNYRLALLILCWLCSWVTHSKSSLTTSGARQLLFPYPVLVDLTPVVLRLSLVPPAGHRVDLADLGSSPQIVSFHVAEAGGQKPLSQPSGTLWWLTSGHKHWDNIPVILPIPDALKQHLDKEDCQEYDKHDERSMMYCTSSHFSNTEPGEESLFSGSALQAAALSTTLTVGHGAEVERCPGDSWSLRSVSWKRPQLIHPSHGAVQWLWHPVGKTEIIPSFSNAEQGALPHTWNLTETPARNLGLWHDTPGAHLLTHICRSLNRRGKKVAEERSVSLAERASQSPAAGSWRCRNSSQKSDAVSLGLQW